MSVNRSVHIWRAAYRRQFYRHHDGLHQRGFPAGRQLRQFVFKLFRERDHGPRRWKGAYVERHRRSCLHGDRAHERFDDYLLGAARQRVRRWVKSRDRYGTTQNPQQGDTTLFMVAALVGLLTLLGFAWQNWWVTGSAALALSVTAFGSVNRRCWYCFGLSLPALWV